MCTPKKRFDWRPAFIESFRKCGNVTQAAKDVGIARRTAYQSYHSSKEFRDEWDNAEKEATEVLASEARRRGFEGFDKPVFQGGKQVGVVREYSDTLLIFLMKARDPQTYRERTSIEHSGNLTVRTLADVAREAAE